MNETKKRVAVELKTTIQDAADKEMNAVKANGVFVQSAGRDVLSYKEKVDDMDITTMITIQQEKVSIKRSGAVSMHQQFRLGQLTENVYKHPHGNIHMETFTNTIVYEQLQPSKSARLRLKYTVKLNGQDERNHMLELFIKEEDSE